MPRPEFRSLFCSVGLWQINAEIPPNVTPGPAVPLVISAGGHASNTVTIATE